MIDNNQIEQLVREAIVSATENKILAILSDPVWVESIDRKIIDYVRHRVAHDLANVHTSPEVVDVIKASVSDLMAQGAVPGLDQYVDQDRVRTAVYSGTQEIVQGAIDQLVLDETWLASIEHTIIDNLTRRVGQLLSQIDVNSLVLDNLQQSVELVMSKRQFQGVRDRAREVEIDITDQQVSITNALSAGSISSHKLEVREDATIAGNLTVKNLAVKGSINTDNKAWADLAEAVMSRANDLLDEHWRQTLCDQVTDKIKETGIAFTSVKIDGQELVKDGSLSSGVSRSSLKSVGVLESLDVRGPTTINSLRVKDRRVGINTDDPEMALSVWDEEVSVIAGKLRQNQAYIGTSRAQALTIGINRTAAIDITEQGRVAINHLTVGRHRICHEAECPNYSGTKGDIVFNSNPKNDGIWGWQCLGAFRWVPLRSA